MKSPIRWLISLFKSNREHYRTACQITELIKRASDSREAQRIVDVIPGRFDNKTLAVLKVIVTKALKVLHLSDSINPLASALKEIRTSSNKNGYYKAIAGEIIADLTNLPLDVAIEAGKDYYDANRELIKKSV